MSIELTFDLAEKGFLIIAAVSSTVKYQKGDE